MVSNDIIKHYVIFIWILNDGDWEIQHNFIEYLAIKISEIDFIY